MKNTEQRETTAETPDGCRGTDGLPNSCFEWSADEIRRVGYRVIHWVAEYLTTLPSRPVFQPFSQELVSEFLHSSPPRNGQSVDTIFAEFAEKVAP
jgi:hypothetical protein